MPVRPAELIILRNDFYYRCYNASKIAVALLALTTILLLILVFVQGMVFESNPRYFPTTPDGRLIDMPPIDINHLILSKQKVNPQTGIIIGMPQPIIPYSELQPFGEDALVLYWTYKAVIDMFDYDYIHYRRVIQRSSKYFTAVGHTRFIEALISSRNLETVKARSAIVVPIVDGNIELVRTYMVEGHYAWDLRVPLRLTYTSFGNKEPIVQNLIANVSVARVSTLQCPFYGLAIYRINFELGATS